MPDAIDKFLRDNPFAFLAKDSMIATWRPCLLKSARKSLGNSILNKPFSLKNNASINKRLKVGEITRF